MNFPYVRWVCAASKREPPVTGRPPSCVMTFDLVQDALAAGLAPVLKVGTATGYAGVTKIKGKYQARFYCKVAKRQRAVPGLHDSPRDAALALAAAKAVLDKGCEEGIPIPLPAKRKPRGRAPLADCIPVGVATPLTANASRSWEMPLAAITPLPQQAKLAVSLAVDPDPSLAAYSAPAAWEVSS